MDIDHITRWKDCNEQQLPGTIYCSCGQQLSNLQPEYERKFQQDTQTAIEELQHLKDVYWKTCVSRGIKGGGTGESQHRHQAHQHYRRSIDGVKGLDGVKLTRTAEFMSSVNDKQEWPTP